MQDSNHKPPKFISTSMDAELFNRLYHRQDKEEVVEDMANRFHLFGVEKEELIKHAILIEEIVNEYRAKR